MGILRSFTIDIMETSSILILWSTLQNEKNSDKLKKIIVAILVSLFTAPIVYFEHNSFVFLGYLFYIILLAVFFKKRLIDVIIEFIITILAVSLIEGLLTAIAMIFNSLIFIESSYLQKFILTFFLMLSCFAIYFLIPIKKYYIQLRPLLSRAYFFIIITTFYIIISKFIWDNNIKFFLSNIILFIIIPIAILIYYLTFLLNHIKFNEQKQMIETYNKYAPILENIIKDVRRRQHDFKNHLNTIYGIIEVTEEAHLKAILLDYIKNLNGSFKTMDYLIGLDNKVISAIIYSKLSEAKSRNINFVYTINISVQDILLKDYEISEILSNLLDNAFEAVEENITDDKNVYLLMQFDNNNSIIEVRNSGIIDPEILPFIFTRGFSTKASEGHGYGLHNVKTIVENYKGIIQLSFENNMTIFNISF